MDGVLYTHELIVATEALPTGIGTGLYVETIEIGARAGTVRDCLRRPAHPETPGSLHLQGRPGVPRRPRAGADCHPRADRSLHQARRPAAHYRLTGVMPTAGAAAQE